MSETAEFIARYIVAILALTSLLMMVLTVMFWELVLRYAPGAWQMTRRVWDWARYTAPAMRLRRIPVLGRMLRQGMSVMRFLGAYAVLAFAAAVLACAAFLEIADEIGVGESLAQFDVQLSVELGQHVPGWLLLTFAWLTRLGDPEFLYMLGAIVALGLLWRSRWQLALVWTFVTLTGGLLTRLLKLWYERTRPAHDHGFALETGWSFPSGHAAGAMLVYGLLGYLLVRHAPARWHMPIVLSAMLLIVFVGSSRVVLQVHFLSDVLAGYISAGAWLALCVAGLEAARWQDAQAGRAPFEKEGS